MGSYEDEVAAGESSWEETQEQAYQDLEDGQYQARITVSRVEQTSWDQTWQLFLQYSDTQGRGTVPQWLSLDPNNEVGFEISARVCKQLGYSGSAAGLKAYVEEGGFIDLVCDIKVETKTGDTRDFKRVYVNRVHGKAAGDAFAPAGVASGADAGDGYDPPPPPADEDIPF